MSDFTAVEYTLTDSACKLLWRLKAGRYAGMTDAEFKETPELEPDPTDYAAFPIDESCLRPIIGDEITFVGNRLNAEEWGVVAAEVARRIDGTTVESFLKADDTMRIGMLAVALNTQPTLKGATPLKRRKGRPSKDEKDSATKVLAALAKHHGYDNGSVTNHEPATNRQLADEYDIAPNALSRFLSDKLGGHKQYAVKCHKREIGAMLTLWHGDLRTRDVPLRDDE